MTTYGRQRRALAGALRSARIPPTDAAAVQLATRYADLIDAARDDAAEWKIISELGPKYLAALSALGMTKAGRGVGDPVGGGEGATNPAAKHDEISARRRRRAGAG